MQSLPSFLQAHNTPSDIAAILNGLMTSCVDISNKLQQGALAGILGCAGEENIQGETQKKLDVISNDIIKDQLASMSMVKGMASEEEDFPVACNEDGEYLVLFDPLDGSSNIDVNVTVGTIFSILKTTKDADAAKADAYLQAGTEQVSAGYVLSVSYTHLTLPTILLV